MKYTITYTSYYKYVNVKYYHISTYIWVSFVLTSWKAPWSVGRRRMSAGLVTHVLRTGCLSVTIYVRISLTWSTNNLQWDAIIESIMQFCSEVRYVYPRQYILNCMWLHDLTKQVVQLNCIALYPMGSGHNYESCVQYCMLV